MFDVNGGSKLRRRLTELGMIKIGKCVYLEQGTYRQTRIIRKSENTGR
jgi:Fe2+ transport system protein FeoA